MTKPTIQAARDWAEQFIRCADAVLKDEKNPYLFGTAKTGKLRRASMDLTRALAEMRRTS